MRADLTQVKDVVDVNLVRQGQPGYLNEESAPGDLILLIDGQNALGASLQEMLTGASVFEHAAGGPVVVVGYLQVERVCKVEHELERLLSIEVLCKNVEWLTRHLAAALVDTEEARGEHSFRGVFEQLLEG